MDYYNIQYNIAINAGDPPGSRQAYDTFPTAVVNVSRTSREVMMAR
jgi:hypothetical protein